MALGTAADAVRIGATVVAIAGRELAIVSLSCAPTEVSGTLGVSSALALALAATGGGVELLAGFESEAPLRRGLGGGRDGEDLGAGCTVLTRNPGVLGGPRRTSTRGTVGTLEGRSGGGRVGRVGFGGADAVRLDFASANSALGSTDAALASTNAALVSTDAGAADADEVVSGAGSASHPRSTSS